MTLGNLSLARQGMRAIATAMAIRDTPTPRERDLIAQWPGWGPLAPVFDENPEDSWGELADALYALLEDDPSALQLAKESVDNAFYTSDLVVDILWDLVTAAGFTGGRVLEPGCGSGRFLARAPQLAEPVEFVGVERDLITARIAQLLHPAANIVAAPLERTPLQPGSFDLAIGNVPFSSTGVFDRGFAIGTQSLHSYFLARSLAAVRHGAYVALVISRHLLDTPWVTTLPDIADVSADFVGAMRLPTGTFRGEGTDVVSDIVLFRRNADPEEKPIRVPSSEEVHRYFGSSVRVSTYWTRKPSHIAGTVNYGNHHAREIIVTAPDSGAAIRAAAAELTADLLPYLDTARTADYSSVALTDCHGRKEGAFHLSDAGEVIQIRHGEAVLVRRSPELVALIRLRDAAVALSAAEADYDTPDHELTPLRAAARDAWESYVARFGPLNRGDLIEGPLDPDTELPRLTWRRPRMGGFRADPDYITVLALEDYNPDTRVAHPAAILTHRVNRRPEPRTQADTPAEALAIALGETGAVALNRIAGLLHVTPAVAQDLLGDLVYRDPQNDGELVPARNYLSGNVRRKLAAARTAAKSDPAYADNVAALKAILPPDLGPLDIDVSLGMPWITPRMVQNFAAQVIRLRLSVEHEPVTASWSVEAHHSSAAATTTFGTQRMSAVDLIKCALNGKAPIVYDEEPIPGDPWRTRKVRNPDQTLAAQDKLTSIQERFATWIWENERRSSYVCKEYNRRLNSHVVRRSDGAHLTFPTAAGVTLWKWQRDIVDQIVSTPATFCAHAVGAGKTLSMISAAVQLRRLGLAHKPMIVVPNHLLEQIAREARQAYPSARFLIADKSALAGESRRVFAARCATGDWDAVIITHSSFGSIPVSVHTEQDWLLQQKAELEEILRSGPGYGFGPKEIARRLRSLENQLHSVRAGMGDPNTVRFEHLGVDWIGVDEAHAFKRLGGAGMVTSRAEGFSFGSSKRATDLYLKLGYLRSRSEGRPYAAFFSGTPWTNTLAETFVWQKYLQPEVLSEAGVAEFDAWAAVFVKRETKVEIAPDGSGFRIATRPTALKNLPELRSLFLQCADILPSSELPLERPELETDTIVVQPSPGQEAFVAGLVRRADTLRGTKVDPKEDNMLRICGEGRRVALDPRLVGVDEDSPKLAAIADRIVRIHNDNQHRIYGDSPRPGAFQLVFCDLGTPLAGNQQQTYGRLRAALVKLGMNPSSIRFVHEATTDHAKAALFAACRAGEVSVLIGSTEKVGMGTNVQTRLLAMHHLDAPWRPSDVEQRIGRGIRPGNLNQAVSSIRYITARTFDAYIWQLLERKARFMSQMMRADLPRTVEDIGEFELDAAQVKGLATGNPLVLERAEVMVTLKRLRTLRAVDAQSVRAAARDARSRVKAAEGALPKADLYESAAAMLDAPVDEAAFAEFAETVHRAARRGRHTSSTPWNPAPSMTWRGGLRVKIVRDRSYESSSTDQWRLRIHKGYREVFACDLRQGTLARSTRAASELLRRELEAWEANVSGAAAQIRREHREAQRALAPATGLFETYAFPRQAEIRAAEGRLAAIEAEMEGHAIAPPTAA